MKKLLAILTMLPALTVCACNKQSTPQGEPEKVTINSVTFDKNHRMVVKSQKAMEFENYLNCYKGVGNDDYYFRVSTNGGGIMFNYNVRSLKSATVKFANIISTTQLTTFYYGLYDEWDQGDDHKVFGDYLYANTLDAAAKEVTFDFSEYKPKYDRDLYLGLWFAGTGMNTEDVDSITLKKVTVSSRIDMR